MSDHPLAASLAGLRELRAASVAELAGVEREMAGLPALAAGTALLAMVLAGDERQLETVRRVAAEFGEAQGESDPPRAVALLTLLSVRHLVGESEELGQLAARLFQESDQRAAEVDDLPTRSAARLAGAARTWGVLVGRLDETVSQVAALDAADGLAVTALQQTGEPAMATAHEALAQALAALAALTGAEQVVVEQASDRAFGQVLALAERLAMGRGTSSGGSD